jgi:hypothetical protein
MQCFNNLFFVYLQYIMTIIAKIIQQKKEIIINELKLLFYSSNFFLSLSLSLLSRSLAHEYIASSLAQCHLYTNYLCMHLFVVFLLALYMHYCVLMKMKQIHIKCINRETKLRFPIIHSNHFAIQDRLSLFFLSQPKKPQ